MACGLFHVPSQLNEPTIRNMKGYRTLEYLRIGSWLVWRAREKRNRLEQL